MKGPSWRNVSRHVVLTWKPPGQRVLLPEVPCLCSLEPPSPSPCHSGASHPVLRAWVGPEAILLRVGGSRGLMLRQPHLRVVGEGVHPAAGQAGVSSSVWPRWATQSSQVLTSEPLCGAGSWEPPGPASSLAHRWSQGCHTDCVPYPLIENPQALRKVAAPVHSDTVSPAHASLPYGLVWMVAVPSKSDRALRP